MNISKKDIVEINKKFDDGVLRNESSLDYALDKQENKKFGEYKKLEYLVRAVLIDHPFRDGNKKTAMMLIFLFADKNNKVIDEEALKHHILSIASRSISDIRNIEWRLKNCILEDAKEK